MKHLGLASPAVYGLGCSCQGKPITRSGLGAPANLENTVANFHLFLNELEKKGVPKANTDKMLELVRYNLDNGIDPNMAEIVQKAFLPAGQLAAPTYGSYGLPNMSFGSTPSFSLTSNSVLTTPSVLTSGSASNGGGFGGFMSSTTGGIASSLVGNMSVGGVKVGGIANAVTGLISGNPLAAIGLVTSLIPMDKTFGAVFANGFNLSCWGSTAPPSLTKAWGEADFKAIQNNTLDKGLNEQNLYDYLDNMNAVISQSKRWGDQMKKCSQTGLLQYHEAAKKVKEGVIEGVKAALEQQNIKMIPIASVSISKKPTVKLANDGMSVVEVPYQSERFNIIVPQPQPQNNPSNQGNQANQGNQGSQSNQGSNTNNGNQGSGSSSSAGLLLGGALLALKLLI